jgi:hypothetical protein
LFEACNCHSGGSKSENCNFETGQCDCLDRKEGRQCDRCVDNYWNFPVCEKCECNGFADTCNQTNGECINCRENTYGSNCEM